MINRAAILAQHRDISLSEQIAHFNQKIHVAGQYSSAWNGLSHKQIKERIDLPRGGIEHTDLRHSASARPTVRSNPFCFGMRRISAQFARESVAIRNRTI